MKAIILEAGKPKELKEILGGKPKCLAEINGNSILEINLNVLHAAGIQNISIVRGYGSDNINIPGLNYYDNLDYENTNMLYSLMCASNEFNDDIIVTYGDIIYDEHLINRLLESKYDIAVGVMTNVNELIENRIDHHINDREIVIYNSQNQVVGIGKSSQRGNDDSAGLFNGIIKFSYSGINFLKKNYDRLLSYGFLNNVNKEIKDLYICELLHEMAGIGVPINCVYFDNGWQEINTIGDIKRAEENSEFIGRLVKVKSDWQSRSETYNKIDWVNRDDTIDEMLELSTGREINKILDVGTGTGKVLIGFKNKYKAAECFGIDSSVDMMKKISDSYGFKLTAQDVRSMSFDDNSFDIVTARMILHHVSELDIACKEVLRVLKPGGRFIICEGTPPDRNSVKFYEEMFRYKEDRNTFLIDDLSNLLFQNGFDNISAKIVFSKNMSLNNWLENAGVPFRNIDIIRKMHYECDEKVKQAYNMKVGKEDIIMDWKFAVVSGSKPY